MLALSSGVTHDATGGTRCSRPSRDARRRVEARHGREGKTDIKRASWAGAVLSGQLLLSSQENRYPFPTSKVSGHRPHTTSPILNSGASDELQATAGPSRPEDRTTPYWVVNHSVHEPGEWSPGRVDPTELAVVTHDGVIEVEPKAT